MVYLYVAEHLKKPINQKINEENYFGLELGILANA